MKPEPLPMQMVYAYWHMCRSSADVLGHIYSWHRGSEKAFWGCFTQKMVWEPNSFSGTRCFSLYVHTQTLGSGSEIIIFKNIHCDHVKVAGPSETPDTTLKLLQCTAGGRHICMLIKNQEAGVQNFTSLWQLCFTIISPASRLNI